MLRCSIAAIVLAAFSLRAEADLITHFNFNTYDGDSATIAADSGSGMLFLAVDGSPWPAGELDAVSGTSINAINPDPAGTALSLGNNGNDGSLRTLTFALDTTGFSDLMFSLAISGSNASFDTADISYSLDGMTFFDTFISLDPSTTGTFELHSVDLSGFAILDNQPSLFIRATLLGDNLVTNQHLNIDNIAFEATPTEVPEAPAWVLMLVVAACSWRRLRGRSADGSASAGAGDFGAIEAL